MAISNKMKLFRMETISIIIAVLIILISIGLLTFFNIKYANSNNKQIEKLPILNCTNFAEFYNQCIKLDLKNLFHQKQTMNEICKQVILEKNKECEDNSTFIKLIKSENNETKTNFKTN